jgi:16S rRNA (cytosine967-C5)-methyltransferase
VTANTRELAFLVVRDTFGAPPREAQASFEYRVGRSDIDERDRAFTAELAYGTIKARRLLDWWLKPFLGDKLKTLPNSIAEIVRLGVYQLLCMDGVAPHAAVHETVGVAMRYGHRGTAGLVNAVLRRIEREQPPRPKREDFETFYEYVAISASLPTWIVERLAGRFGDDAIEEICAALNQRPQLAMTVDPRRTPIAELIAEFQERDIKGWVSPYVSDSILVDEPSALRAMERGGRGFIQSESAAMPVDLLAPQPGETVLELCAGRGNKTLQIAGRLQGQGTLESIEIEQRKADRLIERLAEAGYENVTVRCEDAIELVGDLADAVLVDAPCSALGILGHHPEARWRKNPEDAERHSETQRKLLRTAFARLKPQGRLVYSVCSPDPCEGEAVIERLLINESDLERAPLPERYAKFATPAGDLVIPPGLEGRDGFYVSLLRRR